MIVSASRRTDIPTYFSEWFFNRIKEGYLYVRNPMNIHQISRIALTPDVVDCIVFWTKNPIPMLNRLDELKDYMYYFQFTLTGYGKDMEANLPDKKKVLIPAFKELSDKIGANRVIWRYDPIVFSNTYSVEYHLKAFDSIAGELKGYTKKCVISFVDIYKKNEKNMEKSGSIEKPDDELRSFAKDIVKIASQNDMIVASCAEKIDLSECGIEHNHCVDKEFIENLIGYRLKGGKDKVQREECGCFESMEVGAYNTCKNGCRYCYANFSPETVESNFRLYDPDSPLLCSPPVTPMDKITERKVKSLKTEPIGGPVQLSLFDNIGNK